MTFASEVKKECTLLTVHREHAKAELAALIRMSGSVNIYHQQLILNIQSENAAIARRMYSLLKDHFQVEGKLIVRRKMKLKKNNVYILRVQDQVHHILSELDIISEAGLKGRVSETIMQDPQKKRSYLRGAFLAGGSVNHPESSHYHLEIYSNYEQQNQDICQMMNDFNLNAKMIERRNGHIAYLKEAEKIADFLSVIGAVSAMLKFEDVRIIRDMRNSANRMVNCDQANLNKTIDAAQKQIQAIQLIEDQIGLGKLPDKLQEIAQFRLDNPDLSMKDIGEQLPSGPISKSGVNHRFRKLIQIAEEL